MPAVLITGANRGIGYQHATQYAAQGWEVHACARQPDASAELRELAAANPGKVVLHALDVTDHDAVDALWLILVIVF